MPQYLRKDSVRLLEASMESLALAITGLGLPVRREFKEEGSRYAAPIGLVGVAAEQAMSAMLVQTYGPETLMRTDQRYKTAREILDDMRILLRNPVPRASFLTSGVGDEKSHRELLLRKTEGFVVLVSERAAGLHAGRGPSRDVAVVAAEKVYDFLKELSRSNRIRSYLDGLPVPPQPTLAPNVMVDDLAAQFRKVAKAQDRASLLSSIFLVLPEVPESIPDWIDAFDRIAIAPREDDLSLLITTLSKAIPVQLHRASLMEGAPISVIVKPGDPSAIPIAPQQLRRSFNKKLDQFLADIGNANGRLDEGTLHLPPEEFVFGLSVLGQEGIRRFLNKPNLSAHEAWPFIVAALHAKGTAGPYWFLVRMTDDIGQLYALVQKAMKLTDGKTSEARVREFSEGVKAIRDGKPLPKGSSWLSETKERHSISTTNREKLVSAARRNNPGERALSSVGEAIVEKLQVGECVLGDAVEEVLSTVGNPKGRPYWARTLAEAAFDPQDLAAMVSLLDDQSVSAAHTAARKAIRLIDATTFGPPMILENA